MTDASIAVVWRGRNGTLWNGDVFELFLKPECRAARVTIEFQANPAQVVLRHLSRERADPRRIYRRLPRLGRRGRFVLLKGTLDQPGDRGEGWTVEGRIPWSAFAPAEASRNPAPSGSSRFAGMTTARREPTPSR